MPDPVNDSLFGYRRVFREPGNLQFLIYVITFIHEIAFDTLTCASRWKRNVDLAIVLRSSIK